MFEIMVMGICMMLPSLCVWMARNWHQHTDEWRDRRFIDWLQRPLPRLESKHRERITNAFPSEEWPSYPYCMIDAIVKPNETADEVIKWAIYYTLPEDDRMKDKEYRSLVGLR
jgi:hypothetical protein